MVCVRMCDIRYSGVPKNRMYVTADSREPRAIWKLTHDISDRQDVLWSLQ